MDTSDESIEFDDNGVCNHCHTVGSTVSQAMSASNGAGILKLIDQIKSQGRQKEYDCILGLSGGVDSSYLALKAKEWGLRPLVFHVDAGWNSELAVHNIERICKECDYDLHTYVVD